MTCVNQTEIWQCGDQLQLLSFPCGSLCPEGRVLWQGHCVPGNKLWECQGQLISFFQPCQGKCFSDHLCLDTTANRCFFDDEFLLGRWTCDGLCSVLSQNWTFPCDELCPNSNERIPNSYNYVKQLPGHQFGYLTTPNGPLCYSQANNIVNTKELPNCRGVRLPAELDCNRTVVVRDQEECHGGRYCGCRDRQRVWQCGEDTQADTEPCKGRCQD